MAMLAESRRKQKISTDPRGNAWRKDGNKFGQKLMEKMGWSEGKGLGANEDGDVNHVGITVKPDKKGVGCSKSYADNWIAHQDDFSALLDQLNEDHRSETPATPATGGEALQQMEQKSKTAKGRVHYQKFTKGKDLSLKSAMDLDCVFGKRKSHSGTNTPDVQASSDESGETTEIRHGVNTIRSTDSIQEYFARKMAEKKSKLNGNSENENKDKTSDEVVSAVESAQSGETKKKKKKKKKDKKKKEIESVEENVEDGGCGEARVSFMLGGEDSDDGLEGQEEGEPVKKKVEAETESVNEIQKTDRKKSKKSKKNKRKHCEAFNENKTETDAQVSIDNHDNVNGESQKQVSDDRKKSKKAKKQKKREKDNE